MKRKILAFALCLAAIITITGCSSNSDGELNESIEISFTTKPEEEATSAPSSTEKTEHGVPTDTAPLSTTEPDETLSEASSSEETEVPDDTTEKTTEATSAPEDTTQAQGQAQEDYNVLGENNILVISKDGHYVGLMACWGTMENCETYAQNVEDFASALPSANVWSMIVPTSVEFYLPAQNEGYTASQKKKIDYIASLLSKAKPVDCYSALEKHTDEHIFARTDHHWQPLGAYYAAEAFAKTAGLDFPKLSEYEKVQRDGYVGSMYNYSKDENLYNDPETFTMYISPNDVDLKTTYYDEYFRNGYESDLFVSRSAASYYCSFLGSDDRIAKIETGANTGKTLVVIKESYGNAVVPFLTSSFDTIYVLDLRYLEYNAIDFCKEVGATDVLFAMCTFTPAGGNVTYLDYIMTC